MFLPIIIGMVSILVLAGINATYGAKVSQYIHSKKPDTIKILKNQEEVILNAVNQYCEKNFDACFTTEPVLVIDKASLVNYMPKSTLNQHVFDTGTFNSIELDMNTKKINIKHNILEQNKQLEYKSHYLNKNLEVNCIDDSSLPCINGIKKQKEISNKLAVMYIQKEEEVAIEDLSNELGQINPDIKKIKLIEEKIKKIQSKKTDLLEKN